MPTKIRITGKSPTRPNHVQFHSSENQEKLGEKEEEGGLFPNFPPPPIPKMGWKGFRPPLLLICSQLFEGNILHPRKDCRRIAPIMTKIATVFLGQINLKSGWAFI